MAKSVLQTLSIAYLICLLFLSCQGRFKNPNHEMKFAGTDCAFEFPVNVDWINTKKPLTIAELKGKIVLLHFWKYSCIHCLNSLVDLKKLERNWKKELVVIGIHSPKFPAERNIENVRQASLHYEINYPIINDSEFILWRKYGISSWPTSILIDPNGMVFGIQSGEGILEVFDKIISNMVGEFKSAGLINLKPIDNLEIEKNKPFNTTLLFPGKLILSKNGTELFVSDTNHNRVLVINTKSRKIIDVIGNGKIGSTDGKFSVANFNHPQGLAIKDEKLYIADTENHTIRIANLKTNKVSTLAGTGKQAKTINVPGIGRDVAYNTPWDIVEYKNSLYITMRGTHQIWILNLESLESEVFAGCGSENIFDGKLEEASLAQPTGITKDEIRLFYTDSEASAIRSADLNSSKLIKTIIGKGLFEFGDLDDIYPAARLQFPMGISYSNGKLYIADTYNNKIKIIDPEKKDVVTLAGTGIIGADNGILSESSFFEPSGVAVFKNLIYIADTNNNLIRLIDLNSNTVSNFDFE